ncbi:MAG: hypothetical protein SNJ73_02640 [Acetobacteraceae bacterium]
MSETLYADGVTEITVVGTNARIHFHVLQAVRDDPKAPPTVEPSFTVAMPIEALAQVSESLPKLVQQLLDTGRLKRRAPSAA